jgi:hypothetical protein
MENIEWIIMSVSETLIEEVERFHAWQKWFIEEIYNGKQVK